MRQPHRSTQAAFSDRDVESSNATLNTVFGGARQKSWMVGGAGTGPVRPTPRRPSVSTETPVFSPTRPQTGSAQGRATSTLPTPAPSHGSSIASNIQASHEPRSAGYAAPTRAEGAVMEGLEGTTTIDAGTTRLQNDVPGVARQGAIAVSREPLQASGQINIVDLLQSPSPEANSPQSSRDASSILAATTPARAVPSAAQEQSGQVEEAGRQFAEADGRTQPTSSIIWPSQIDEGKLPSRANASGQGTHNGPHPAKRQRVQVPAMPSLRPRIAMITAHLSKHGGEAKLSPDLEKSRFRLLTEACGSEDIFYVAVHQLFCTWGVDHAKVLSLAQTNLFVPFPSLQDWNAAFVHLTNLLRPNSGVQPVHMNWFADFPSPLHDLIRTSEAYQKTVQHVINFLLKLVIEWTQLLQDCFSRNYPPLVEELVERLGVHSPILQAILFTAARRDLGVIDSELSTQMYDMFREDQREHQALAARMFTDRPPMAKEIQERRGRLAGAYSNLLSQAVYQSQTSSSVPPPAAHNISTPQDSDMGSAQAPQHRQASAVSNGQPLSATASPDINTAAQSMSLNSPTFDSSFVRRSSRPTTFYNRQASQTEMLNSIIPLTTTGHLSTPVVPSNAGTVQTQQQNPLQQSSNLVPVTSSAAPVSQQYMSPAQQIENELQYVNTRWPANQMPKEVYDRQQFLLQQRSMLQQQQQQASAYRPVPSSLPGITQQNPIQNLAPDTQPGILWTGQQPNSNFSNHTVGHNQSPRLNTISHPARRFINSTSQVLNSRQNETVSTSQPGNVPSMQRPGNPPGQQFNNPLRPSSNAGMQQQSNVHSRRTPNAQVPLQTNGLPWPQNSAPPASSPMEVAYKHLPTSEWPLVPPLHVFHTPQAPNPDMTALHQAHLRSPNMVPKMLASEEEQYDERYYQVVNSFAYPPTKLSNQPVTQISFTVSAVDRTKIGLVLPTKYPGQVPSRDYASGTLQYRMRCVKRKLAQHDCPETDWVVTETSWPATAVYFQIHDGSGRPPHQIEVRRKNLHAKDLPVNLTQFIQSSNIHAAETHFKITMSTLGDLKCFAENNYFFAVEIINITSHSELMASCQLSRRESSKTLSAIKTSLIPPSIDPNAGDDDDEVALISSEITLNITDPFSSVIFDIPVRGNNCLHRECFDLETFLLSRGSKSTITTIPSKLDSSYKNVDKTTQQEKSVALSLVDVWRCPLCNRDARPLNLHVDEFLVMVRRRLVELGAIKRSKAIVVNKDGLWKPRVERPVRGAGRGSVKRKKSGNGEDSEDSSDDERDEVEKNGRPASAATSTNGGRERSRTAPAREVVVIDLSD